MKKTIIITIITVALFAFGVGLRQKFSGEKFDSEKWKNADMNSEENFALRWDMMNNLRNDYKLVGMSKKEIVNLLGKPSEDFNLSSDSFEYYLGYSRTGINTGSLRIKFSNDIVESISVWQG